MAGKPGREDSEWREVEWKMGQEGQDDSSLLLTEEEGSLELQYEMSPF